MLPGEARKALAALTPHISASRMARMQRVAASRISGLHVVLENMADPRNAAACLRTADALGVHTVHVVSSHASFLPVDVDSMLQAGSSRATAKHTVRAASGSLKWLQVAHHPDIMTAYAALRAEGATIMVSALGDASQPLEAAMSTATAAGPASPLPLALVFGNEQRGTSKYARGRADALWHVPQAGMAQSMNVGVAMGIGVYSAVTAMRRAGLLQPDGQEPGEPGTWPGIMGVEQQEEVLARWALLSVTGAEGILARAGIALEAY